VPDLAGDLARKEQVGKSKNTVLCLPPKYREVLVLCSLQELSYEKRYGCRLFRGYGWIVGCTEQKQLLLRKLRDGGLAGATARSSSVLGYGL